MTTKSIYILCPPNKATGGPEALHQLGYLLKNKGCNIKMLYSKIKVNPVHQFYKVYDIPYAFTVKDSVNNIIIIPESMTNWIARYPLSEKKIWWLSLDFYEILMNSREQKKNFFRELFVPYKHTEYRFEKNQSVTHWYQSQRAKEFLLLKNLENPIKYLCDYVADLFFENLPSLENFKKENIITYNPKKGLEKLTEIIISLPHYHWIPLQEMTRTEMRDVLRRAKLHVDFGYFPGRDKIPREALISGCCLLTGRGGTAAFKEDLGIPEKYKLHPEEQNPDNIKNIIIKIMNNYEDSFTEFLPFREFVMNEKQRMNDEIDYLFNINTNNENFLN
jgi:hypothetical protein